MYNAVAICWWFGELDSFCALTSCTVFIFNAMNVILKSHNLNGIEYHGLVVALGVIVSPKNHRRKMVIQHNRCYKSWRSVVVSIRYMPGAGCEMRLTFLIFERGLHSKEQKPFLIFKQNHEVLVRFDDIECNSDSTSCGRLRSRMLWFLYFVKLLHEHRSSAKCGMYLK